MDDQVVETRPDRRRRTLMTEVDATALPEDVREAIARARASHRVSARDAADLLEREALAHLHERQQRDNYFNEQKRLFDEAILQLREVRAAKDAAEARAEIYGNGIAEWRPKIERLEDLEATMQSVAEEMQQLADRLEDEQPALSKRLWVWAKRLRGESV